MELLLIALVMVGLIWYIFFSKGTRRNPHVINETTNPELYKPRDITDDSHLKAQLAALQSSFTAAQQELGQLQFKLRQSNEQLSSITAAKIAGDEAFQKLQFQNKSSQVRTGAIGESLLPLHEEFPCDPKTLRLLGSPVDYISFCYETNMLTFIEVKTGDSQLNDNQRKVKQMVEEGRVQFKVVRLNEKGIKVK